MNTIQLSRKQMRRMVELTEGYMRDIYEFWVSDQHLLYLTIFNVVYMIDIDGAYDCRRKSDGSVFGHMGPLE